MARAKLTPLQKQMQEDAGTLGTNALDVARVRKAVIELEKLRKEIEEDTAALDAKTKAATAIETELLPTLFDEAGVSSLTIDGRPLKIKTEYHPFVLKANEQKFFAWLRKNKFDGIIKNELKVAFGKGEDGKAAKLAAELMKKRFVVAMKQGVHASTLKAFVKEQTEKRAPLPPELDVNPVRIVKID